MTPWCDGGQKHRRRGWKWVRLRGQSSRSLCKVPGRGDSLSIQGHISRKSSTHDKLRTYPQKEWEEKEKGQPAYSEPMPDADDQHVSEARGSLYRRKEIRDPYRGEVRGILYTSNGVKCAGAQIIDGAARWGHVDRETLQKGGRCERIVDPRQKGV